MIDQNLLDILVCPETKEPLSLVPMQVIEKINSQIEVRALNSRNNKPIKEKIDGGLLREDKKFLYAIRDDIPIMLIDESIAMDGLDISF